MNTDLAFTHSMTRWRIFYMLEKLLIYLKKHIQPLEETPKYISLLELKTKQFSATKWSGTFQHMMSNHLTTLTTQNMLSR